MGVPRIIRRVEAAKKDDKIAMRLSPATPSIDRFKPKKKKRADKLRALAGAIHTEANQAGASSNPIEPLDAKYNVHEKVGQGKEGVAVFRCTERSTGRHFAVKRVPSGLLGKTHGDERPMVEALRGCAQLVETHEVIVGTNSVDYVMELAHGGDLFEHIATRGALDEHRAKRLFVGILTGLRQVHQAGLIHRDVKLENVLLMHPEASTPDQVRLADFEFCAPPPAVGAVGSIAYAAPEATREEEYSTEVDIWAAGVCLYAMLSASAPFDSPEGPQATEKRIQEAIYGMEFPESCWEDVTSAAKDLINGMLHPDRAHRLTMQQVMAHPWFADERAPPASLSQPASSAATAAAASAPRPERPKSPKFQLRLAWHGKMKRWSSKGSGGVRPTICKAAAGSPGTAMLLDDEVGAKPIISCPLEWAPRPRSHSL